MRTVLALIVLLAFAVAPVHALDGRRLRLHGGRLVESTPTCSTIRPVPPSTTRVATARASGSAPAHASSRWSPCP